MDPKKILLIDDDESILRVLEISLASYGFQLSTAAKVEVALDKLRTESFDLVVIDYFLPGMDGGEICRRLRNQPGFEKNVNVPVLFLSGRMETPDKMLAEVKTCGGNEFLAKPFEVSDLVAKIQSLI